jgi:hypothetical protein
VIFIPDTQTLHERVAKSCGRARFSPRKTDRAEKSRFYNSSGISGRCGWAFFETVSLGPRTQRAAELTCSYTQLAVNVAEKQIPPHYVAWEIPEFWRVSPHGESCPWNSKRAHGVLLPNASVSDAKSSFFATTFQPNLQDGNWIVQQT